MVVSEYENILAETLIGQARKKGSDRKFGQSLLIYFDQIKCSTIVKYITKCWQSPNACVHLNN